MAITDWPADERPREKLLTKGVEALSDAELLAIFLRVGIKGKSAVDLARDLLTRFDNLSGIFSASRVDIAAVPGIGASKYTQLQAIFEMVKRALGENMQVRDILSSPELVRNYLRLKLQQLAQEVFIVLFLDVQNRLIASEQLFTGTLSQTSVYPREVVRRALHHNAASVVFAHNHPSGVAEPSGADESLTRVLKNALALIDVRVLDHFLVASDGMLSFAERGLI